MEQSYWYLVYYLVIAAILGLALLFGRRAGCHTICWMAPFMMLGRKLGNWLNIDARAIEQNPSFSAGGGLGGDAAIVIHGITNGIALIPLLLGVLSVIG